MQLLIVNELKVILKKWNTFRDFFVLLFFFSQIWFALDLSGEKQLPNHSQNI